MQLASIPKFLVGNREAIIDIARSRDGLLIGLLFVLSAGFAREYDAEYLVKQPWHVLIPLAASLVASLLFFWMSYGIGKRRGIGEVRFLTAYRSFLALFWMTAPLAWLYAIPFERFCDPFGATVANLWMLRIVSIWRVALMTRVVSVFFGCGIASALWCVMLVADVALLVALAVAGIPMISLMGGINVDDSAALIRQAAFTTQVLGVLSLPVWIIGAIVVGARKKPQWTVIELAPAPRTASVPKFVATCSVLAWFIVLPFTQAEQRLRYEAEMRLRNGQIADGLAFMSKHERSDFPPLWDPPPRPGFRVYEPHIPDVMLAMLDVAPADWVRSIYTEKFRGWLGVDVQNQREKYRSRIRRAITDPPEVEKVLTILEGIPEGRQFAAEIELESEIERARDTLGDELVDRSKKLAGGD